MTADFLKYNNIPHPPHIDEWIELEYARIVRFKGDVNSATLPKILDFKIQLDKAGLATKNIIFDGKKVNAVDSSTIAAILIEMQQNQRIGIINPPAELRSYLTLFHQEKQIRIFETEEEALSEFNVPDASQVIPVVKRTLKKNKSLTLMIALLLFLIALPFLEDNMTGIFYLAFFSFVLLSGIYAVSYNIRHVAAGILLATPTLVTAWSNVFLQEPKILTAELVFLTIFLVYTCAVILRHILSLKRVTINELYGAICVYIMVGMTFGVIYALLISLDPSSLAFPPEDTSPKLTAFFYFSFVTMSSTGFSGFTAISPLARSIVIVQVIIGVMYVSALIGKLVGANSDKEEGFSHLIENRLNTEFWQQSLAENFFRKRPILLVLSMIMLNYSTSVLMTVLNWPIFMDSWGTSLAVILGGLWAGILAGVGYNLIMAMTFWNPSDWVWMFCNILIALLTWFFAKGGWIDLHRPGQLLLAGLLTGVLNSVMVGITTYVANVPMYQGVMLVHDFFMNMTGNEAFASIAEKMAVEVADKTISLLLVAVAVIFIRDFLNWNRKTVEK